MKWQITIMILTLFSFTALAAEDIGVVALKEGEVWKVRKGKKTDLLQNEKILEKDEIITGKDGFVKILMNDDTIFDFGEATKFSFDKFKMKTKSDREANYNFSYGKMRSIFTIKAKDEEALKIKTPDIVMGVRGTEILADVFKKGTKLTTNVSLISGKLNISGFTKNIKKSFSIKPGVVFNSTNFKKFAKPNKFLRNLSRVQFNALKNTAKMTRGSFLFDKTSGKKQFPVNNEMKKILNIKADNIKVFDATKMKVPETGGSKPIDANSQKGLRNKFKENVLNKFQKPTVRKKKHTYNRIQDAGPAKVYPKTLIKPDHHNDSQFNPTGTGSTNEN
jgi:hypothetical protein